MPRIDRQLGSPFRIEWLAPLDRTTEDDYSRAVAEKAHVLLQSARFMATQHASEPGVDLEVRIWVEAAIGNACVSITWEPGARAFGFHLLDESLRERLACIVFDALPCVDAPMSREQADHVLDAALRAIHAADPARLDEIARLFADAKTVRVPVQDAKRPEG